MSFKLLDQLENLTPVWKFVEAELPSEPCLNNLERLRFVICLYTKDLLLQGIIRLFFVLYIKRLTISL